MGRLCLGFDTSNYTTSAAVFDGETGENRGKLLTVPEGARRRCDGGDLRCGRVHSSPRGGRFLYALFPGG